VRKVQSVDGGDGGWGSARWRRGAIVSPGDGLIGVVVIETGVEVRILVYRGGGGSELR
jgi:hypothetical protein